MDGVDGGQNNEKVYLAWDICSLFLTMCGSTQL